MSIGTLREKIKSMRFRQAIYPLLSFAYLALVVVLFVFMARFLTGNIDRAFVLDEQGAEAQLIKIDMETFSRVAGKLGIPLEPAAPEAGEAPEESPQPEATPESPAATPNDKKSLSISILNTTRVNGLASEMRTALQLEGFVVSGVGNAAPVSSGTVLQVKENKNSFTLQLSEIIKRKYTLSTIETLEESAQFDVIILLGPPNQ